MHGSFPTTVYGIQHILWHVLLILHIWVTGITIMGKCVYECLQVNGLTRHLIEITHFCIEIKKAARGGY